MRSGSSYVSRREFQLSPVAPQQTEKRTITVIPLPPRPAEMDDSAGVTGPADSSALADSAGVTGPTTRQRHWTQQVMSQQGISAPQWRTSRRLCTTQQLLLTQQSIRTQQVPTQHTHRTQQVMRVGGSGGHGTPAGTTPVARQDTSMVSDVSSLRFPSLPRSINQATLVDFMPMWTLMQRRMDSGMAVPDTQSRPVDQTPTTRHDQASPRRSGIPVRHSRTPDRRPRTPVRRARGRDESRDSTRSWSPIRRLSSTESCTRDASPVDFSAALNTEEKVKDRSISEDEDDEGSQKKVSAAQYQLFRQAVKSSKGTFKVNPSKSRRAAMTSAHPSVHQHPDQKQLS